MAKSEADLFAKKKETAPILDLSKSIATTKEEFRKLLEKVPDFKIRAERVPTESIKIKDKKNKFKTLKHDLKTMKEPYAFMDPLPEEMRSLKISELATVSIDWKMLTSLRPKTKLEENYFSRLVELGKLERKTRIQEKRQFSIDSQIRKNKNKAGVVETKVVSCAECGEEYCNGKICSKFTYDCFVRVPEIQPKTSKSISKTEVSEKPKRKIKIKTGKTSVKKKLPKKKSKLNKKVSKKSKK